VSSINDAAPGDGIAVSDRGTILGGHHRWDELKSRVAKGDIDPNKELKVDVFKGGC
jgi:hypothetical protein